MKTSGADRTFKAPLRHRPASLNGPDVGIALTAARLETALPLNLPPDPLLAAPDYPLARRFRGGVTEVGCMAHARRKLHSLHVNDKSSIAAEALRAWLEAERAQVPEGSATAKAILYSLRRWPALTRYLWHRQTP